jgi:hypothetical protein
MHSIRDTRVTYFARTNARNSSQLFGIKRLDRLYHTYIIGKTGTGKTNLLKTLIMQDIYNGEGLTLVEPHGDMAEEIVANIPDHRKDDLIYFNVPDHNQPYGYNPVSYIVPEKRSLAASGILEVFHKYWGEKAWGQRMEYILRNALLAILELPNVTLIDLLELLRNNEYRKSIIPKIKNEQVRSFWRDEYPKYSARYRVEAIAPIQNKVGAFLSDPLLFRILTKPQKPLKLRKIMDERKILIVNLAKGKLGEDTAGLFGALLVTTLGLASFSRADIREHERKKHFLFMDEFQSFTTPSIANMLSELRKYSLGITACNQYLSQLQPEVRDAVLGNVGTVISFRLGAHDATFMAKEFFPTFQMADILNLPNYEIFLKLMIHGAPSKPFSATTITPRHASSLEVRLRDAT